MEINNYSAMVQKLKELYNTSRRNRYYWSLSLALYNLQSSAPRLLLALKKSDSPDKVQRKAGIENIEEALMQFRQAWQEVQLLYSQTRFISYPPNYVPDRYFHLASQRENLSWMIQAEELYEGMIKKWLQREL